jgi:hypothetical protein
MQKKPTKTTIARSKNPNTSQLDVYSAAHEKICHWLSEDEHLRAILPTIFKSENIPGKIEEKLFSVIKKEFHLSIKEYFKQNPLEIINFKILSKESEYYLTKNLRNFGFIDLKLRLKLEIKIPEIIFDFSYGLPKIETEMKELIDDQKKLKVDEENQDQKRIDSVLELNRLEEKYSPSIEAIKQNALSRIIKQDPSKSSGITLDQIGHSYSDTTYQQEIAEMEEKSGINDLKKKIYTFKSGMYFQTTINQTEDKINHLLEERETIELFLKQKYQPTISINELLSQTFLKKYPDFKINIETKSITIPIVFYIEVKSSLTQFEEVVRQIHVYQNFCWTEDLNDSFQFYKSSRNFYFSRFILVSPILEKYPNIDYLCRERNFGYYQCPEELIQNLKEYKQEYERTLLQRIEELEKRVKKLESPGKLDKFFIN